MFRAARMWGQRKASLRAASRLPTAAPRKTGLQEFKDPIERFHAAFERAREADPEWHTAAALATVGADGRPSVRMVLLKDVRRDGFVFYTNLESRKVTDIRATGRAAMSIWWRELGESVRVEGTTKQIEDEAADRYWASRPRGSQLGAWASRQSAALSSRSELVDRLTHFETEYEGREVPRPPFWSGFVIVPDRMEFWRNDHNRLHHREAYTRTEDGAWRHELLYP